MGQRRRRRIGVSNGSASSARQRILPDASRRGALGDRSRQRRRSFAEHPRGDGRTRQAVVALGIALGVYGSAYLLVVFLAGRRPPSFLLDAVGHGVARRTAGALLWVHVAVSYAINSQALCSCLAAASSASPGGREGVASGGGCGGEGGGESGGGVAVGSSSRCGPRAGGGEGGRSQNGSRNGSSGSDRYRSRYWWLNSLQQRRPRLHWAVLTSFVTVAAWLVANAVPFFSDLVSLIGGLTQAPLSLLLPALLYRRSSRPLGRLMLLQRPRVGRGAPRGLRHKQRSDQYLVDQRAGRPQ